MIDPERLLAARWFAGKGAQVEDVRRVAGVTPPGAAGQLAVLAIRTSDGAEELYSFPGELVDGEWRESADPRLWRALFDLAANGGVLDGDGCRIRGFGGPAPAAERADELPAVALGVDQSHTTFVVGPYALKLYRHLVPGAHPEIELTRTLTEAGFPHTPAVHGSAVVEVGGRQFGLLHLAAYLPDAEDGFAVAKGELGARSPADWASGCGRVLGELHGVLAELLGSERATEDAVDRWRAGALAQLERAQCELAEPALASLMAARPRLEGLLDGFRSDGPPLVCRIHGDLHVGQFLRKPDRTLAIIDFEGEPGRPTEERRAPASPMRDLATLLRSFDHAGFWVRSLRPPGSAWDAVAEAWISAARDACITGYGAAAEVQLRLLAAFEAEKAVNELIYAQRFIPSWTGVATSALRRLCNSC